LLWAAEAGDLDALQCPRCGASTISVSFTHTALDKYRVYFICSKCSFRMSGGQASKPADFSEDRMDADLQAFDTEVLRKIKFARPQNQRTFQALPSLAPSYA
jgi:hypothetical protein